MAHSTMPEVRVMLWSGALPPRSEVCGILGVEIGRWDPLTHRHPHSSPSRAWHTERPRHKGFTQSPPSGFRDWLGRATAPCFSAVLCPARRSAAAVAQSCVRLIAMSSERAIWQVHMWAHAAWGSSTWTGRDATAQMDMWSHRTMARRVMQARSMKSPAPQPHVTNIRSLGAGGPALQEQDVLRTRVANHAIVLGLVFEAEDAVDLGRVSEIEKNKMCNGSCPFYLQVLRTHGPVTLSLTFTQCIWRYAFGAGACATTVAVRRLRGGGTSSAILARTMMLYTSTSTIPPPPMARPQQSGSLCQRQRGPREHRASRRSRRGGGVDPGQRAHGVEVDFRKACGRPPRQGPATEC